MRPRRVREVRQFTPTECGLCCIAMILSAYGSRNSVTALRRVHETGRDGLSLKEVAAILREHRLEVRSFRCSTRMLAQLKFPLIAYWDGSHLVVLEKFSKDRITLVDPASGRRRYDIEKFERHYSGLVVEATPTTDYRPVRHREPNVWREFLQGLGKKRSALAFVFAMSLLLYCFTLLMPITIQFAINNFASFFDEVPLSLALLIIIVPATCYVTFSIVRTICLASVIRLLGEFMMGKTFRGLLGLPFKYFASRSQGELMYRLSSVSAIRDMISSQLPAVLLDLGSLLVALCYIFYRSSMLGLVALAFFICMVGVGVLSYRPIRKVTDREISETAESSTMQLEALSSMEILKVSGMTEPFFRDWKKVYAKVLQQTQRRVIVQGIAASTYSMLQMFGPLVVLVTGLWLVRQGSLDLGSAVAVQTLTATGLGTMMSLSNSFSSLIVANAQVTRLGDILHQAPTQGAFGDRSVGLQGAVSVHGVGFTYPGASSPVLEGVSFDVPAGSRVAIVGSTGSGKSTLGKLLVGLYPVSAGEISFDGVSMREISADSFYGRVAYVPQEIVLSNRTILDNIRFCVPDAGMEAVVDAATRAQIQADVEAMPLGYFTQVREMGGSLSGGQRQRIAIARALASRPRVLVLDEATSSLDTVTESMITEALGELECTQIIIAHRLSTIVNADLIVVLQEGRVVQIGRHSSLVSVPGPYKGLLSSQVDLSGADAQPNHMSRRGLTDEVV